MPFNKIKIPQFLFKIFSLWVFISATLLISYIIFIEWVWQGWYYIIWSLCAGGVIYKYHIQIKNKLTKWNFPTIFKYVIIIYSMVLTEEILASTLNHLSEGWDSTIYIARIGQFWALNILAFSGMIWGSYLVLSKIQFTRIEMFCVFGIFGQISEHLIYRLIFIPDERIAAFVLIPLNFVVYGIIFLPAIFLIEDNKRKNMPSFLRYPLVFFVIFVISIPFITLLEQSRIAYPDLFPPRHMVR